MILPANRIPQCAFQLAFSDDIAVEVQLSKAVSRVTIKAKTRASSWARVSGVKFSGRGAPLGSPTV
jgi:hypothetical protein